MQGLQVSRIESVKWADSEAVKGWKEKVRAQAMSALQLARTDGYAVFGVRNTKSLIGIVAVQAGQEVAIKHMATRDGNRDVLAMLIHAVVEFAGERRMRSPFPVQNWRKVGAEYWSK